VADQDNFSDIELLALLNKEDRRAFDAIYNRYWEELYKSAYRVLRDQDACMDVLQEVFVWLWEHRDNLVINNLKYYLISAVKYKISNYIRREKIRRSFFIEVENIRPEDLTFTEDSVELKELTSIILSFTAGLPERARAIFQLSRYEHLSNKEIAERLGISEKTVENQMTTNLKKLRSSLGRKSVWLFFFI